MTFEEINGLSVEDIFETLLDRILDLSVVPYGEPLFMLDMDEEKTFYERVIVHQSLVKPSLTLFNAELVEVKAEWTTAEQERLDEIVRVEDLTSRFSAMPDIQGVIGELGIDIPNPELEFKRIVAENDQTRMLALEGASASFQQRLSDEAVLKQESDVVDSLVDTCLGCIKIVMKHNIKNSLTKEQKDQQAVDYASVFDAIKGWRPGKAKTLISASTPDGTLVTQALKDELVAFLTSRGI